MFGSITLSNTIYYSFAMNCDIIKDYDNFLI